MSSIEPLISLMSALCRMQPVSISIRWSTFAN